MRTCLVWCTTEELGMVECLCLIYPNVGQHCNDHDQNHWLGSFDIVYHNLVFSILSIK